MATPQSNEWGSILHIFPISSPKWGESGSQMKECVRVCGGGGGLGSEWKRSLCVSGKQPNSASAIEAEARGSGKAITSHLVWVQRESEMFIQS